MPAANEHAKQFGRHVRSLRRVRGVTQEALAERAGLSTDTIRRIEYGNFSPSLDTLTKVCRGLSIQPSTLFESFELGGEGMETKTLLDLIHSLTPPTRELAIDLLRVLAAHRP